MKQEDSFPSSAKLAKAALDVIHDQKEVEGDNAFLQLAAAIKEWNVSHKSLYPYAKELGNRGWTIPVWEATVAVAPLVLKTTGENIDDYFLREYSRRLRFRERRVFKEILKRSALTRWHPLLRECIIAYRRQNYLIAAPALFAAFEGVLAEVAGQFQKNTDAKRHASARRRAPDDGIKRLAWVSIEAFTSALFQSAGFTFDRPPILNRNWVVHGRDPDSATQADCLRLLHAIHTVSFLSEWEVEGPG